MDSSSRHARLPRVGRFAWPAPFSAARRSSAAVALSRGERTCGAAPRAAPPRIALRARTGGRRAPRPRAPPSRVPRARRDAGRTRRQPRPQWAAGATTSRARRGRSSGTSLALARHHKFSPHSARSTPPGPPARAPPCRAGGPGLLAPSRAALRAAPAQQCRCRLPMSAGTIAATLLCSVASQRCGVALPLLSRSAEAWACTCWILELQRRAVVVPPTCQHCRSRPQQRVGRSRNRPSGVAAHGLERQLVRSPCGCTRSASLQEGVGRHRIASRKVGGDFRIYITHQSMLEAASCSTIV
eukprot:scaffold30100_cov90-Phaeocystis_antarctica.AAC.2